MRVEQADVVVVGSGLAGISAAIEASRAGARVALLTTGTLCGGSSFSPHTWGLGMVTPLDTAVERRHAPGSLAAAMQEVGAHQNKPELVDALMEDGAAAVAFLTSLGATVSEPAEPSQREYVPCFDTRVREWHGFHARDSREALKRAVRAAEGVAVFEYTRALSLVQPGGVGTAISGVAAWRGARPTTRDVGELLHFEAPAVVLATGGLASTFAHSFGGEGWLAAAMAYDAGAAFTNLEFLQLMMAFASHPRGAICNEKLWRYASVVDEEGVSVFARAGIAEERERAALEAHSWHGPFTTARESRLLELAVQAAEANGHRAYLRLSHDFLAGEHPEFVDTYLAWLSGLGCDPEEPAQITLYAHSSNGGIAIDTRGATAVPGLFAASECAGGVHGADRIGGLASVSALVFGRRAGVAATQFARAHRVPAGEARRASPYVPVDDAACVEREVGVLMDAHCLVNRTEEGLRTVLSGLDELARSHCGTAARLDDAASPWAVREAYLARGKLVAARLLAEAMLRRGESLGSHHRADAQG